MLPALLLLGSLAATTADTCNFGPTHHSHLVLPTATTLAACQLRGATFLLSHGATFFCPHTFDVKLLATIVQDTARATLCATHFSARAQGVSSKMVLRPTLPAGGLPRLARGEMAQWVSPVMYHVHKFGKGNDAGPNNGWNVTTVRTLNTTIEVQRVLYGRMLDVQPSPAELTYLAHNASGAIVLSHYISQGGASGFDQIARVVLTRVAATDIGGGATTTTPPLVLRDSWPTFLTVTGHEDAMGAALSSTDDDVAGVLHVYDAQGLPATIDVRIKVELNYYVGASDGFAGYGTMCPFGRDQVPQSPSTCGMIPYNKKR